MMRRADSTYHELVYLMATKGKIDHKEVEEKNVGSGSLFSQPIIVAIVSV